MTSEGMQELKPCPFCEGDAGLKVILMDEDHHVRCWSCRARTGRYRTTPEAIAAWNTRPAESAQQKNATALYDVEVALRLRIAKVESALALERTKSPIRARELVLDQLRLRDEEILQLREEIALEREAGERLRKEWAEQFHAASQLADGVVRISDQRDKLREALEQALDRMEDLVARHQDGMVRGIIPTCDAAIVCAKAALAAARAAVGEK